MEHGGQRPSKPPGVHISVIHALADLASIGRTAPKCGRIRHAKELAFSGQNGETPPDETERLKRRIRELENEVELLKKVSAYFAKHPQ